LFLTSILRKTLLISGLAIVLSACAASSRVVRVMDVPESADTPYKKVLVVSLFNSFDARRYLEKEIVDQLSGFGTEAVASTTMMNSLTPVTRETFVAMVDKIGADAVLVTRLVSLESDTKIKKDDNTRYKYSLDSTYYYNVYEINATMYVEPETLEFNHSVRLATQLISVARQEPIWAIESSSEVAQDAIHDRAYSIFVSEAKGITSSMRRDGLIAR
jgi:hypothetical protein